jgi:hypothetical protein
MMCDTRVEMKHRLGLKIGTSKGLAEKGTLHTCIVDKVARYVSNRTDQYSIHDTMPICTRNPAFCAISPAPLKEMQSIKAVELQSSDESDLSKHNSTVRLEAVNAITCEH